MVHIRVNKYLSSLGIASRRKIDMMASEKRIRINGELAEPGDKVNPEIDTVIVDKKIIAPTPQKLVYYALNKPKYVLSSSSDDRGRQNVVDFVPQTPRVYPVGRLDFESTGLILLTNDGDLALRLTHPRFHLPKVYLLTILGKVPVNKISQLEKGIKLEDGLTAPTKTKIIPSSLNQTNIELTMFQGKKRQIRRMCAALHLHLLDLHRLSIGPININNLAPGHYRELSSSEIRSIRP
jgi:23S rRNA pseudouridine2605 synthase